MSYIVDLHTHSRFSRACSNKLNIPNLVEWAKFKGIDVLGTGDFLHPVWMEELKRDLIEEDGFLKHDESGIKFALSVEIASIYSHKGKVRRVHNVVLMPSFESARKLQQELSKRGANLVADGRPVVGISSKTLLSIALEVHEKALFIPAHAWTPWFGVFGSQSGYDSLADCFEDLTKYVYAIETGLSSDPAMNWRVSELDNKAILSFSDAHSLPNLGREMTEIDGNIQDGFGGMFNAIKNLKIKSTIEFFPEEGKYHYTGHRNCGVVYTPTETKKKGVICPVCGRSLTVGVMERVEAVANRSNQELRIKDQSGIIMSETFPKKSPYRMLVPLQQVISESFGVSTGSKKVQEQYFKNGQQFSKRS